MTLLIIKQKLQDLYKYSIAGSAPRFDSVNGNQHNLTLTFMGMPQRTKMDNESLANVKKILTEVYKHDYEITEFTIGRNYCMVGFTPVRKLSVVS